MSRNNLQNLTAIDLFSGAGGLTLGLKKAGFNVVSAVEYESTAAETYKTNHPEVILLEEDILGVDPHSLLKRLDINTGDLDLLAGCPPCQGFSTIGTRNKAGASDPRNDFVYEIVRFARIMMPKTIMMENVPALATDSRMDAVRKELENLGYSFSLKVLNTANFGVPQRRRRMIMICSRLGEIDIDEYSSSKKQTVRDTITSLPAPGTSGDLLHDIEENRSERIMRRISLIPEDGGSRTDLPIELQLNCHRNTTGFKDVYGRMKWDEPSPTITGGCSNPSKGRFLHPSQNRTITLREAALLQTFPKTYKFSFKSGKQGVATMIGNALPPTFIKHHAKKIALHLALAT